MSGYTCTLIHECLSSMLNIPIHQCVYLCSSSWYFIPHLCRNCRSPSCQCRHWSHFMSELQNIWESWNKKNVCFLKKHKVSGGGVLPKGAKFTDLTNSGLFPSEVHSHMHKHTGSSIYFMDTFFPSRCVKVLKAIATGSTPIQHI